MAEDTPKAEAEEQQDQPETGATEGDQTAEVGTEEAGKEEVEAGTKPEKDAANAQEKIVPGMVVRVHLKVKETTPRGDERERIQVFEGTVIAVKGRDANSRTITVRKVSGGIGVERIFPLKMPTIAKIEVVKRYRTRRSKLYYLRNYKKRLKEVKEEKVK